MYLIQAIQMEWWTALMMVRVQQFDHKQCITTFYFTASEDIASGETVGKSSQTRKKMFSQEPLEAASPSVIKDFDIEDPKVTKRANRRSNKFKKIVSKIPRKTLIEGNVHLRSKKYISTVHCTEAGVRKSSRQHLGTIRYWEQRLNYVYVDGVATINTEKPITGLKCYNFHMDS